MAKKNNKDLPTTIILKVKPRYRLTYIDAAEEQANADFKMKWKKLNNENPWLTLHTLFPPNQIKVIKKMIDNAVLIDPTYKPVDFSKYFYVMHKFSNDNKKSMLLTKLEASGLFESVEDLNQITLATVVEPAIDTQDFLLAAPGGIDAYAAWNVQDPATRESMGKGKGIDFIDLEKGWDLANRGLGLNINMLINPGSVSTAGGDISHGTQVLGIIYANGLNGCNGIAPDCNLKLMGLGNVGDSDIPSKIIEAIGNLSYGGILLLEIQSGEWPIEMASTVFFEAIRLGTALGVVIIEPSGNAGQYIGVLQADSGAIMVGGVTSSDRTRSAGGADQQQDISSNFSERVDCFAWYNNIFTTSTTPAGTDIFGGTSGASAIVAGASISLQSLLQFKLGRKYNSFQMRHLFSVTGTTSANPLLDLVGVMPNLGNIDPGLNTTAADVYVRDTVNDIGDLTVAAHVCSSPDIITSPNDTDPNLTYGAGSGTEFRDDLSSPVYINKNNYIYVRVLNRGIVDAGDVVINLYYSLPSTLISHWNYIGSTTIRNVPARNILTVSDPITWNGSDPAFPGEGHYCYVAVIGNTVDPPPVSAAPGSNDIDIDLTNMDTFRMLVKENNNIAWRNFNIIQPPTFASPVYVMSFLINGHSDKELLFDINFTAALPQDTIIKFEFPDEVKHIIAIYLMDELDIVLKKEKDVNYIEWNSSELLELKQMVIPPGISSECRLTVSFKGEGNVGDTYFIAVSQVYEDRVVGKISWKLLREPPINT